MLLFALPSPVRWLGAGLLPPRLACLPRRSLPPALDRFSFSVGAFNLDPKLNASFGRPMARCKRAIKPGRFTMPRITADVLLGDSQASRSTTPVQARLFGRQPTHVLGGFGALAPRQRQPHRQPTSPGLSYKWWLGSGPRLRPGRRRGLLPRDARRHRPRAVNGRRPVRRELQRHARRAHARVRRAPPSRPTCGCSPTPRRGRAAAASTETSTTPPPAWVVPVKNVGVVLAYGVTNIDLRAKQQLCRFFAPRSGLQGLRLPQGALLGPSRPPPSDSNAARTSFFSTLPTLGAAGRATPRSAWAPSRCRCAT